MKHIEKALHWVEIILFLFAFPGYVYCTLELYFGPAPFEKKPGLAASGYQSVGVHVDYNIKQLFDSCVIVGCPIFG